MKLRLLSTSIATPLLGLALSAMPLTSVFAAQSSAYAFSADLVTDGSSHVQVGPLLSTSGSTSLGQSYDKPLHTSLLSKTVRLLPGALPSPALSYMAQTVSTDASGASGVDAVNTSGTSGAAAGVMALTLYPPIPLPQPASSATDQASLVRPQAALLIQFNKLEASSDFSQIFPGPTQRSGHTSAVKITLSGALIGPKALTFSGDLAPNTVAIQTPRLKITLNAQAIPQQPVCDPGVICPLYRVVETVDTKAVLIELNKATLWGHQVTGHIAIADAQAGQ